VSSRPRHPEPLRSYLIFMRFRGPVGPIGQRRNYTADTIRGYIHAVKEFAEYFGKSPDLMGAEEVREFQLYMIRDKRLALGTVALRMGALRFLYKKTLRRRDIDIDDLPLVRGAQEVARRSESGRSGSAHRRCAESALPYVADAALRDWAKARRGGAVEDQRRRHFAHVDPRASGEGLARSRPAAHAETA
jgi:hypothetical protein